MTTLLIIQFFSSFWMFSIIWFVQIVHYPLFLNVPKPSRIIFAQNHQQLISFIVMPAMLIELVTLTYITFTKPTLIWVICFILLSLIWGSTFFLQVPCHNQCLINPTNVVIKRLINTNWIRTICWSLKTIIIGIYLFNII